MSLSKEAVQHIQETANAAHFTEQLQDTNVPLALVPDSFKVQNLEMFMAVRSRLRLNFKTESINDFVAYSIEHGNDDSGCFIDSSTMSAETVFDIGTTEVPLHQDHKAIVALKKTGPYKALLATSDDSLSQKTAAEFIEDWSDLITVSDMNGGDMAPAIAAQRLRDLSIDSARQLNSKVEDFGASMSAMDSIEAKNKDTLPNQITFKCEPYNGLGEFSFTVRVGILTGGDRPKISFRILRLESTQEEITERFKELLTTEFKACLFKTYIGRV
ncbi:hypothetical protein JL49_13510 [Pseudoalteromonas luteoviolacea]|nr:hypothetical protein JL49_13510 [Pseudoalteromonas luteoviolacea]